MIDGGKATLAECQSLYGLEDIYDLLEVMIVSAENERRAHEAAKAEDH